MDVEWHYLCEDCKIEVNLHGERKFSLRELDGLDGDELQECAEVAGKLRGLQRGSKGEETALDRLEMLLTLFLEHRDHNTLLYNNHQDIEVEDLPWFDRWSWTEDITALQPSPVVKGGWKRGLPLGEAVGPRVAGERKKGRGGTESEV